MKAQLGGIVEQMYRAGIRFDEALREFQKAFVLMVLQQQKGNQCKAADKLGMHRNTLRRTITDLQIDASPYARLGMALHLRGHLPAR